MEKLALTLPGISGTIAPPPNVPIGGLFTTTGQPGIGQDAIRAGLSFFLIIVLLLAILYGLMGAMRYIFSRGDKEKIKGAREKITYSIIGLIIAFLAFLLVGLFSHFVNVPLTGTLPPGPTPTPSCITAGGICDFQFGTTPCCLPSVCTIGNLCVTPTPPLTLFVTVTAAPNSSTSPLTLNSFISFKLEGTATGLWKATLRCKGFWTEEINDSVTESTFVTPCTFTEVGNYDVDVDVTRQGVTTVGTIFVTVLAGPTSTPIPTVVPTPIPTGTPIPTPTSIPTCAVDPDPNTLCLGTSCSSFFGCSSTSSCTCPVGFFACVSSGFGCIVPIPTPTPTPTPTPQPIDFTIFALVFSPAQPAPEQDIAFTVHVQNVNSTNATAPPTTVRFYEGASQPTCGQSGWFGEVEIGILAQSAIEIQTFTKPGGFAPPGTYTVWVFANPTCTISELNDTNNTHSILVTVN